MQAVRGDPPRPPHERPEVQHEPLGTAVAVANCADRLDDAPFFVFNGDVLSDVDLTALAGLHNDRGGMGTIFGPIVGAAVIVTVQNYFAGFGAWVTVIEGVIFVVSVLLFREGIIGVLSRYLKKPL